MIKEKYLDLNLINQFIKKNKVKEVKIKKEVYSTNFNFIFILCIGFLGIIIYYKYIEKTRLNKKELDELIISEKIVTEEVKRNELDKEIKLNPNQIRNAVINDDSNEKREKNEEEFRKKFNN